MKIFRAHFHLTTAPLYLTIYFQISALYHLPSIFSPISFTSRSSPLAPVLYSFLLDQGFSFLSVSASFGQKYKPWVWHGIFTCGFTALKLFGFKGWEPSANKLRQNPKFITSRSNCRMGKKAPGLGHGYL